MDDTINDTSRNDAAERDQARHTLSAEEQDTIQIRPDVSNEKVSISQAYWLFREAGIPRSHRQIRRYCKDGDLESMKVDTEHGRKYLIDRNSLEAWLVKLQQTVAATSQGQQQDISGLNRIDPEPSGSNHQEVLAIERTGIIEFLKSQIVEKDKQINALLERDRETNFLIQGLQGLVLALQPPKKENRDGDTPGTDQQPIKFREGSPASDNGVGDNSATEMEGDGVK